MLYEFRSADGRGCCATGDREHLCPACTAALAHAEQQMPDGYARPLERLRTAMGISPLSTRDDTQALEAMATDRAAFWQYVATMKPAAAEPATSDVHMQPPDSYALALERMRGAQR